ncbi:MAG: FAD-dependent oxidoreductase [Rhodomicrobium sp.]
MPGRAEYDAAIVGASIAGCSAAIFLARNGAKVALIERDPDPAAYKKVCTHFIQASATPTIERLGLAEAIEAAGGVRKTSWRCLRDGVGSPLQRHKTSRGRPTVTTSGVRRSTPCFAKRPLLRRVSISFRVSRHGHY